MTLAVACNALVGTQDIAYVADAGSLDDEDGDGARRGGRDGASSVVSRDSGAGAPSGTDSSVEQGDDGGVPATADSGHSGSSGGDGGGSSGFDSGAF